MAPGQSVILQQITDLGWSFCPYAVRDAVKQLSIKVGYDVVDYIIENGPYRVRIEVDKPLSSTNSGIVRVRAVLTEGE